MKIYLVGGAVRDKLLKLTGFDNDWVVTGSDPEQMLAQGYKPVGQDFPVFLHPDSNEEYALARTERKTGKGYKGFTFNADPSVTLEDDLLRRDLTINAIAEDSDGTLIDPHNGRQDLEDRLLRHVSEAFREDPVRVLRVARFMARFYSLGFSVDESTVELMKDIVAAGEIENLTAERVWKEMEKALGEPHPEQFFLTLRECGALEILFPEINRLFGVPQPEKWHPEIDTGVHTMMAVQQAVRISGDPLVIFSTLTHDLGKGITPKVIWPSHRGHEKKGVPLVNDLCDRYRIPNKYRDLAALVAEFHTHAMKIHDMKSSTIVDTIGKLDGWRRPERIESFLLACEADMRGRTGWEDRSYPQKQYFTEAMEAALDIDKKDLIEKGYQGEKMAEQIRRKRIRQIKKYRKQQELLPNEHK